MSGGSSGIPRDASVMAAILKDAGISEYEPRVVSQMLDFSYRYVADVLEDARTFSEHADKKTIDKEDIQLAIENLVESGYFSRPPPRDFILDLEKNAVPLPPVKHQSGLRLPPDRHCLIQPNFRLKDSRSQSLPGLSNNPPLMQQQSSVGPGPRVKEEVGPSAAPEASFQITLKPGSDAGVANKRKRVSTTDEDYDA